MHIEPKNLIMLTNSKNSELESVPVIDEMKGGWVRGGNDTPWGFSFTVLSPLLAALD